NLSGMPSCSSSADGVEQFGEQTPLLVDSGALPENLPTTLLDCTRNPFSIIRSGSIDQKILEDYI
ncbi:MAG: Sua5/YciO/YrdC/YwlC family protein, partial [SAR324 cluster bacterium]|nr:Sua5/YciO/YrdC/YwlC family protein [SAR324 cluster bacterium]